MDTIIEVFKQVIKSPEFVISIIMGSIIIYAAIAVGIFKKYDLIAGVNEKSEKEKAKMDLDYLCKSFGIIFGILGLLILISQFFFTYLNIKLEYRILILGIVTLSFCVFAVLFFNVIKKNRIYKKENEK